LSDDNSLWIPSNKIQALDIYTTHRVVNATVPPYIVARYPESNFQYQAYLQYLLDCHAMEAYNDALPKRAYLDSLGLNEAEMRFFEGDYLTSDAYKHYPVVGLNYPQWHQYWDWKTQELAFAYLEHQGVFQRMRADSAHGVEEVCWDTFALVRRLVFPYRVPTQAEILSGLKSGRQKNFINSPSQHGAFQKWVSRHERYGHLSISALNKKKVAHDILRKYHLQPSQYYDLKRVKRSLKKDGQVGLLHVIPTKVETNTQTGVTLWTAMDVWGVQVKADGSLQTMVGNQRVSPMRYVQIVWNVQRAE
jgi:hypothetical protein